MNRKLLLSASFIISAFAASAQDANRTYAITGNGTKDYFWMNIRQVDVSSGKIVQDVYQNNSTPFVLYDAATKKPVNVLPGSENNPTTSMVAAAAYDKNQNKLFFTPMRIGELRWLDLNAKGNEQRFYTVTSQLLNKGDLLSDESNHITRMVINADGNGYAITNDADHLIRFTTGKKVVITDLGNIIDAEVNKGMSIHNKCSSWGGDVVADAYNKLYVISASHNVFVVDIDTRVATFKGTITGLPANYTTNGAAVDADGKIVVSSANSFSGYYKFDINDASLKAELIEGSDMVYNASDLANANLLFQKEADAVKNFGAPVLQPIANYSGEGHVFPNPVTSNEFKVSFDGMKPGKYTIALSDLSGRAIQNKVVVIAGKAQVETVKITSALAKGMYFVKVTDAANQAVFTEKISIQ